MENNEVKIWSDGTLEKLKFRGDMQNAALEDSWTPTAPFRSFKCFSRCSQKQMHSITIGRIGAFWQANVWGRLIFSLPKVYGDIRPAFKHCGIPLRLEKTMYGMTTWGGFYSIKSRPVILLKIFSCGFFIKIIIHVDDKSFIGNNEIIFTEFKDKISKSFDVEFLGQGHWYWSDRIHQDAEFNVTLD